MQTQKSKNFKENARGLLIQTRALLGGVPFALFETLSAIAVTLAMQEVAGAILFVALIALKLVVCDDILPTTLPLWMKRPLRKVRLQRRRKVSPQHSPGI